MNREETKELIKVMQHYVDGGSVEYAAIDSCAVKTGRWIGIPSPAFAALTYRIALSPENRLIMDAWEADNDCLEVQNLYHGWVRRMDSQNPPTFDKGVIYRIKPKYTPEQQALIDAHGRGESIDCRRLDAEEGEEWVTFVPKPSWIFSTYEYRLTPAPVVIVTHRNHHGDIQYTIKNSKAADSYDGWDNWSVIEERTI